MIFGTDGGLFVSTDGGDSFSSQKNDGISSYLIYALTGNPKHPDDVLIGLQDDGSRWRDGTDRHLQPGARRRWLRRGVEPGRLTTSLSPASTTPSSSDAESTPPSTQHKWLVGWNGIAEFFDPALTYFNTALATPRASADPEGQTFFHRTRFRLYRTTNGAGAGPA